MNASKQKLLEVVLSNAAEQPGDNEKLDLGLAALTPREREVIKMRFGLEDDQLRTLDEVAQSYGITRERIRQVESRAIKKLRDSMDD